MTIEVVIRGRTEVTKSLLNERPRSLVNGEMLCSAPAPSIVKVCRAVARVATPDNWEKVAAGHDRYQTRPVSP